MRSNGDSSENGQLFLLINSAHCIAYEPSLNDGFYIRNKNTSRKVLLSSFWQHDCTDLCSLLDFFQWVRLCTTTQVKTRGILSYSLGTYSPVGQYIIHPKLESRRISGTICLFCPHSPPHVTQFCFEKGDSSQRVTHSDSEYLCKYIVKAASGILCETCMVSLPHSEVKIGSVGLLRDGSDGRCPILKSVRLPHAAWQSVITNKSTGWMSIHLFRDRNGTWRSERWEVTCFSTTTNWENLDTDSKQLTLSNSYYVFE